jgi:hypothetical protein
VLTSLSRRAVIVLSALLVVALSAACSSPAATQDDPAAALRSGFQTVGGYDAVALTVAFDDEPGPTALPGWSDSPLAPLLSEAALEVRSSASEAAHARLVVPEAEASAEAVEVIEVGLSARGLGDLGQRLLAGDWIRIAVPPAAADEAEDAPTDRIARTLATAGTDLVDAADEVRHVGTERVAEHVRVITDGSGVHRFLDDVMAVVTSSGQGEGRDAPADAATAADTGAAGEPTEVDAWLQDGRVVAIEFDLRDTRVGPRSETPLVVRLEITELSDGIEVADDAPAFALRGLADELVASPAAAEPSLAAPGERSGQDGQATEDTGSTEPRDPDAVDDEPVASTEPPAGEPADRDGPDDRADSDDLSDPDEPGVSDDGATAEEDRTTTRPRPSEPPPFR